ncbi:ABC transporter [Streptomyces sp. NPDC007264]|uniref:ABC transporter n=1 Tax=Streptomyces sp. NPDC007264 TaxID=3364777 RepID=UPI0036DB1F9C
MRRRGLVTALVRPTVRSLPWPRLAAGWGLGLVVAAVPVLFSTGYSAQTLVDVVRGSAWCGAVGTAFVLDDPARHTVGTLPVPRPLRQALRVAAVLPAIAVWWTAVLAAARAGAGAGQWAAVPVAAVTVEAGALSGLALALAAAVVRFSEVRMPGAGVAGAVLALPVTAAVLLSSDATPFVPLGDPRWADAHVLWCGILAAVLAAWLVCAPEPCRRLGGLRPRRGAGG